MSWNILCPACGGVLDSGATLKTVKQAEYRCVLCAEDCEPTLDESSRSRSRSVRGCGESRRTIRGRCLSSNTTDKSFGVQVSICPMTRHWRNGLRKLLWTASSFQLARRWCSRSSCPKDM